jgi:hypothetical protein
LLTTAGSGGLVDEDAAHVGVVLPQLGVNGAHDRSRRYFRWRDGRPFLRQAKAQSRRWVTAITLCIVPE